MKKTLICFVLLLVLLCQLLPAALADDLWSEDYYRIVDVTGEISDAERDELDEICIELMREHHVDLAMLVVTSEDYEDMTLRELAQMVYEDCSFGYGEDRTGLQMVWDTDTDEVIFEPFGSADVLIPEAWLEQLPDRILAYREEYGVFGPLYVTTRYLGNYLAESSAPEEENAASEESAGPADTAVKTTEDIPNAAVSGPGEAQRTAMPDWYPADPAGFQEFHNDTAPRVTDTADLFTDEEEAVLEARLAELRAELDRDIVIFTDVSTYGLSEMDYADDFYDYNGYGCGDDYEGVCLFICMDPNNRCWWTSCYGPDTMSRYTEEIANQIDDMLYDHMVNGEYYEGVSEWIENFRRIYLSGPPYAPDWMLQSASERPAPGTADRVTDDAGLLTERERSLLEEQADRLSEAYGADLVIHTALNPASMTVEEFADAYYDYGSYGTGADRSGLMLTIFKRPGYQPYMVITGYGAASEKLTETNAGRLEMRCQSLLDSHAFSDAMSGWLDQSAHMLKTGRAPRSVFSWAAIIGLELIAGLIIGGICLAAAKRKMAAPARKQTAEAYLVRNSLRIGNAGDNYLYTSTSRVYDPVERSSGSSGSSGRSSFSGSHSSSSGRTHSGSGRKF